jgi:hypothetical protein
MRTVKPYRLPSWISEKRILMRSLFWPGRLTVPNETSVQPYQRCIPRVEPKLTQFADLLDSGGDTRVQASTFRRRIPNGGAETTRSIVGSGSFTQPVVRSGDVVHQPAVSPRRIPFPAAESLLAPGSPSPRRDVFSTDDSTRNTNEGFAVMSFPGGILE